MICFCTIIYNLKKTCIFVTIFRDLKKIVNLNNLKMMEATTGLVIKGLREKYGYTQDKVADYLGMKNREMISFYESEEREVPLEVLEKLSDLFGVELDVFFVDNIDEALAEVVFAFRKDDFDGDDMDNMAAFGKIVKNYLKINNLYGNSK